jgi:small-conductance mechanosensitive channel
MSALRFTLILLFAVTYGVLGARKEGMSLDPQFSVILGVTIVGWIFVSQIILRFIDSRNRSRKIQGFIGFLVLFVAILVIEWLVFWLKRESGQASDASASFLKDSAWLVIFPVITYYAATKKRANSERSDSP